MTTRSDFTVLCLTLLLILLSVGCEHAPEELDVPLEGQWSCTTKWTWDNDGVDVPCSAVQMGSCVDNVLSLSSLISIGDAKWSENSKATCHGSKEALYGKRISVQTTPTNDAARQFEKERLGGKALADLGKPEYHVRVRSRTDTTFTGINQEGRIIQCERVPSRIPSAWERKDAHRLCKPMIADYPDWAAPSCQSLHMCANEAVLSDGQRKKLYEIIEAKPDCPGP